MAAPGLAGPGYRAAGIPEYSARPLLFRACKRALDLIVAVPLLLLTLPLQAALAIWIRLDSPGPALFRQQRLTLNVRRFHFYKFRTMISDAKTRYPRLYDYGPLAAVSGQAVFKMASDPRHTRVGRWLRRTSLDELPNLWNVVRGDISLVGPRPEIPELLGCYSPAQMQMFRVKAGVTGLAQISGRDRLTVEQTIALDCEYARRASIPLDIAILFRTMKQVLTRESAS